MPRLVEHRPHYTSLPREDELVLVTSVLGASASWLAQAFIKEALTATETPGRPVVFVGFTRDWGFHAECVRKLGIDLSHHAKKGTFAFIDGLSQFFTPPAQGPPQPSLAAASLTAAAGITGIAQAVRRVSSTGVKPLLVLENPDFILAAVEGVNALAMEDLILDLREVSHSVIVFVNADAPLLEHPRTQLETEHAAFVVGLAHGAAWVVALRMLDTGVARDVSGVVRITRGGGGGGEEKEKEKEVLYYVADGTVEVFDRGQMRD